MSAPYTGPRCGHPTRNGPCGRPEGHAAQHISAAAVARQKAGCVPLRELTLCGMPVRPLRPVPPPPSGVVLPVVDARFALCRFCAADACFACLEGPCKCACRDGAP